MATTLTIIWMDQKRGEPDKRYFRLLDTDGKTILVNAAKTKDEAEKICKANEIPNGVTFEHTGNVPII